ncbi:hypothetical protein L7F22_033184 [Adiantum nelumboides]|nr:hypothetical protein [Adiantum nelumboides]
MAAASSSCFNASLVELPFKRHTPCPWSPSRTLTVKEFKQSRKPVLGCVCSSIVGDLVSSLPLEEIQRILQDDNTVSSTIRSGIATIAELPEEQRWQTLGGTAVGWVYLTARPNVLWGAVDAFVLAPLQFVADKLLGRRGYKRTDFLVEQRVGEGSFGTVFAGALVPRNVEREEELGRRSRRIEEFQNSKSFQKVILKKVKVGVSGAEECGEMEEWFNYRMSRAAPDVCADFLGSFIADTTRGQFTEGGRWLVWKFEGDSTLADFMRERSFPENLSEAMFGRSFKNRDPLPRNALIIKKITRQIITSLKKVHGTGIVHRDVKPANLVITNKGKVKLIDFGAATDLRVGKNYVPNRTMLDPDYCPPELYVMPEATPKPPPAPVAAALSPFIWQFNSPDLYDMYSVGIILMQMACTSLRSPAALQSFKAELEEAKYDLKRWRKNTRLRPNLEILDYDGGKGWDLATKLICQRGFLRRGRLSAGAALRHPYFLLGGDQAATVLAKLSLTK